MSKGQVVSIDYAIATAVFITGLITMLIMTFTLFSPTETEEEPNLDTSFERFANDLEQTLSWEPHMQYVELPESTLQDKLVYAHTGAEYSVLRSEETVKPSFNSSGVVVGNAEGSEKLNVMSAEEELEAELEFGNFNFDGTNFDNDGSLEGSVNSNLEDVGFNGEILMDSLDLGGVSSNELEDKGVFLESSGNRFIFLPGGSVNEFFVNSPGSSWSVEFDSEYDEVDDSFENGILVHDEDEEYFAGIADRTAEITYDSNGEVEATVTGSAIVFVEDDQNDAEERIETRANFHYSVKETVRGIDRDLLEEIIGEENELEFEEAVDPQRNYNIQYGDSEIGSEVPSATTVIARDLEFEVLEKDGSRQTETVGVAYWR